MELKEYKTTCSYCGVGCGIKVKKGYNGRITVVGDEEHPVNKGMLCSKGMNLHHVVENQTDRFLYPEMRLAKGMPRVQTSWSLAMERVVAVFKTMIDKFGPDSVGFYVSGQCLTEEYYAVNKLIKGYIGSNNIDTNSRLCMSSAVVGYKKALGEDAVPISYEDIELADCFFITGANPAWCHPILFRRIEAHKTDNPDVKIIVADPRKTQSCAQADLHLQLNPGTDVSLNNAIAKCIIDDGFVDIDFVKNYTENSEDLISGLESLSLADLANECGVSVEDIKQAAHWIGNAKGFITMWAMGLNQSVEGVNKNTSLLNLSLLTGQIGKPGSGPFSLTGQPNAMGGREVGGMSNLLPAHRDLANEDHRKEVADFWGVSSVPDKPGLTATEMFEALESGKMKAIWVICTNPMVSLPNMKRFEKALDKAPFVVVQDISKKSLTAEYADVVFPAAGWLEKEGTMTNSDRRIGYLPKLVDAPGEAKPDLDILCQFAKAMGYDGFGFAGASDVFDEHAALTKGTNIDVSGLTYDRLKSQGSVQWPYVDGKGTDRLFTDNIFYTPSKKARFFFSENGEQEAVTSDYPYVLTTGRIRDQWHTMTRTGKVEKLNQHISESFLEMHPKDAEKEGLSDGDVVEVKSAYGETRVKLSVTDTIKEGVVFMPMHWGRVLKHDQVRANNLTSGKVDPMSKEPDFKYSVVSVKQYVKSKQKVIIVGAGAAAHQFINDYRQKNSEDEIVVFSKEQVPFYNRVQLPHYVSGEKRWEELLKMTNAEIERLGVTLKAPCYVVEIDREAKTVKDDLGETHAYDVLVLGMGSRANYPADITCDQKGLFTIRSREDADRLMERCSSGDHVAIVGGGLLGLEMASALYEIGVKISVVHRSSTLMERQLDETAGELFGELIAERGIQVFYSDQIDELTHDVETDQYDIALQSGRGVTVDTVIFGIGTIPNIELAKACGLKTQRGVVVNEYMQTSDPSVYALGEIAEFKGMLFGITPAAEEQAGIAVNYILGDITKVYKGSTLVNILKFPEIDLTSIGIINPPSDGEYEEIIFIDRAAKYYKKCLVKDDKLVGAVMLGDKQEYVEFKKLIDSQVELSEKRLQLLRSNTPVKPMKGKLVCSCNNVGDQNIIEEIKAGELDFLKICENTGAGTGCGSCKPEVRSILDQTVNIIE